MNDTPQGDGNPVIASLVSVFKSFKIRMNDTPQGDGNFQCIQPSIISMLSSS